MLLVSRTDCRSVSNSDRTPCGDAWSGTPHLHVTIYLGVPHAHIRCPRSEVRFSGYSYLSSLQRPSVSTATPGGVWLIPETSRRSVPGPCLPSAPPVNVKPRTCHDRRM